MKTIWTLGHPSKRTQFSYTGSIASKVTLNQSGAPKIEAALFQAALNEFRGKSVRGGFKENDPPKGGFGEWVQNNSKELTGRALTPRHASFIAAILCSEAQVNSRLQGVAVWLDFPK